LHFTHKVNFVEKHDEDQFKSLRDNVMAIIKQHPGTNVSFYDDGECKEIIQRVHSEPLANWFDKEKEGTYKSEICKLAVLYDKGGYYFDNDFEVVTDVRKLIAPGASLSAVLAMTDRGTPKIGLDSRFDVFPAFLAAKPEHPAIQHALDGILKWYSSGHSEELHNGERLMWWKHPARDGPCNAIDASSCHQVMPGPVFIGRAIRTWMNATELRVGQMDHGSCEVGDRCAYFFQETADLQSYGLPERTETRCSREPFHGWCNIAVTDVKGHMGWARSPNSLEGSGELAEWPLSMKWLLHG
jgi:hypothetical protein